eukprot:5398758-Pyramimonas_sp.AAC.1
MENKNNSTERSGEGVVVIRCLACLALFGRPCRIEWTTGRRSNARAIGSNAYVRGGPRAQGSDPGGGVRGGQRRRQEDRTQGVAQAAAGGRHLTALH